jgi:hypothetical protein
LRQRFHLSVTDLDSGEKIFDRTFEAKYELTRPEYCHGNPDDIMCTGFEQRL